MAGKLEGKVAIVTAGGAGIGAATVRRFAKEGAAVIIADLSGTRARAVNEEIKAAGGRAVFIKWTLPTPKRFRLASSLRSIHLAGSTFYSIMPGWQKSGCFTIPPSNHGTV
jgi:NAD(P)-dependent dehydrogenase (short-subunit alcohol dehydrogenase family)